MVVASPVMVVAAITAMEIVMAAATGMVIRSVTVAATEMAVAADTSRIPGVAPMAGSRTMSLLNEPPDIA